ncbi:MAG: hypothetical protein U1F83_12265 [Verrucomicrobiota bacterium]
MDAPNASADASSDLALFLKALAEDGRAVVSAKPLPNETTDALAVLQQVDDYARQELALDAPAFSAPAALWAARLFYQLCQFTVCRDIGEEQIVATCRVPCPEPRRPEVDWSADLTFRQLPRLFELARHLSTADPLVPQLRRIAAAWPLSSVGIADLPDVQLDSFISHPALRRLFADRILAAGDTARLGDSRLDDLLRSDLGLHHDLSPTLAAKLFPIHS